MHAASRPDLKKKLTEAKQRFRGRALSQDGVRLPIHAEAELRGTRADDRAMENMTASGGMRNPRRSVEKVPGHQEVGRRVASQISEFFIKHPHIEKKLVANIGAKKEEVLDLTPDELEECLNFIRLVLPFEAYLEQTGDPNEQRLHTCMGSSSRWPRSSCG